MRQEAGVRKRRRCRAGRQRRSSYVDLRLQVRQLTTPSVTAVNGRTKVSITALNAAANKPPPQEPGKNPQDQGVKGAQNAPNPQANEPGGQPAYPAQGGQAPLA